MKVTKEVQQVVFGKMLAGVRVRITEDGRKFWKDGCEWLTLGQWFYIQAHRGDCVDLVSQHQDVITNFPIHYIIT